MNIKYNEMNAFAPSRNPESGSLPECASIVDLVRMRASQQGDRTALIFLKDGDEDACRWNYRELFSHISKVALKLHEHDAIGKRVILLYEPGPEFAAAYLGTLMAGAVAVTAYPPSGTRAMQRLSGIIKDASPDIVLGTSRIRQAKARLEQGLNVGNDPTWISTDELPLPDEASPVPVVCDQPLAMLQYTSGSTASPKGVMVTHNNLMSNCEAAYHWLGSDPDRFGCVWLPPYHDMGLIGGILQPLYEGFPVVLMSPAHFVQQPARWLRALSRYRCTATGAPNFAYDLCVDQITEDEIEGIDLSCVKVAFCGAEPIRKETLDRFCERFARYGFRREALNPCYGLAEATLMVSGKPVGTAPQFRYFDKTALDAHEVVETDAENGDARAVASCGAIGHGLQVRIVDPNSLLPCPPGTIGEIWVTGRHVAAGYWQREDENERIFQARLSGDPRRYMRTGDLGFLRDDELFVTGRLKDLIIIAGRNHYPQDIELTVQLAHPAVQPNGVAAFAVEADSEERLAIVAEVRRAKGTQAVDLSEMRRAVVQLVTGTHGVSPADIHFGPVGTVPRTTSGKVQRQACKRAYLTATLRARS